MSKVCRCSAYSFPHREKGGKCAPNARHRIKTARESKQDDSGSVFKTEQDLGHLLSAARLVLQLRKLSKAGTYNNYKGALNSFDIHPRIHEEAKEYMRSQGMTHEPITTPHEVDPAHHQRISNAYENMQHNPNDPQVKASYDALKKETKAQFDFLKQKGYQFHPINEGSGSSLVDTNPESSDFAHVNNSIRNNKTLHVFTGGDMPANHPLAEPTGDKDFPTYNDMFRAVHDVFGHGRIGVDFGSHGEDYAWKSHASMYSPAALPALTSETRGQNTNFHYGKNREYNYANPNKAIFPEQKAGLLPDFAHQDGTHSSHVGTPLPNTPKPGQMPR